MANKYERITINGDPKGKHRLIMEQIIGRVLDYNEVVHHIDGNTQNNDILNLKIMSRKNHSRLHVKYAKRIQIKCKNCNKLFELRQKRYEWIIKSGVKNLFCCKRCSYEYNILAVKKLDPKIVDLIKFEFEQGLSGYAIAKKHSLNNSSVYNKLKELNEKI